MNKPHTGTPKPSSKKSATSTSASPPRDSARAFNSNSPHASAADEGGLLAFGRRQRSLLSHPLGLPLFRIFNGLNPDVSIPGGELIDTLLGESRVILDPDSDALAGLDSILQNAVHTCFLSRPKDPPAMDSPTKKAKTEPDLTKAMSELIEPEYKNTGFHSDYEVKVAVDYPGARSTHPPRIDILLSTEARNSSMERSTPLVVIEVGRKNANWWQKFDQGCKYVVSLGETQADRRLDFKEPILYAVLTVQGEHGDAFEARQAVFLCTRKGENDMRMTLLVKSTTNNIPAASKGFGRLLRVTSCFKKWRDTFADETVYQYLSSSCCKVGDYVLRSYDSRFRQTERSPHIYLHAPEDIVGGKVTEIAKFPTTFDITKLKHNDIKGKSFWDSDAQQEGRGLLIIAMPYRKGCHVAKSPRSFLPIIDHLQSLHRAGFVHGDIRAFNTVFDEQEPNKNEGCLIDFDYGGVSGQARYPTGYQARLPDGQRIGGENKLIEKWHDWYAMGRLMFGVHIFNVTSVSSIDDRDRFSKIKAKWIEEDFEKEPTDEEIDELKLALVAMAEQEVPVKPNQDFKASALKLTTPGTYGTHRGATGSPPDDKKHYN